MNAFSDQPLITKESLLRDFESKDRHRIWSATWEVIKTRNIDTLTFLAGKIDQIKDGTSKIELGGAIGKNRDSLNFAVQKLIFFKSGSGCLCELYPKNSHFSPEEEQRAGNVVVLNKKEVPYASEFKCQCTVCKKEYTVQEGEYHFTFWEWRSCY